MFRVSLPTIHKKVLPNLICLSGMGRPFGLDMDSYGRLYVADMDLHCVVRFDKGFEFIQCFDGSGSWSYPMEVQSGRVMPHPRRKPKHFNGPHSVAVAEDGTMFVTTYYEAGIFVFSSDGELIKILGRGRDNGPQLAGPATGVLDDHGGLWVTEYSLNAVFLYDAHSLSFRGALGGGQSGFRDAGGFLAGTKGYSFDRPHMSRCDDEGNLIVVDTWNHRLQKFTSEGQFLGSLGQSCIGWSEDLEGTNPLSSHGRFSAPVAISFDDQGDFIVTDWGNSRLMWFNSSGQLIIVDDELNLQRPYDAQVFSNQCFVANSHCGEVFIKSAPSHG